MKKSLLAILLTCAAITTHAQDTAVVPEISNAVVVAPENSTIVSITDNAGNPMPTVTLQYGSGSSWAPPVTVTTANLPLYVANGGLLDPAGDPAVDEVKSVVAQQTNTAYVITLSSGATQSVPALTDSGNTPPVTSPVSTVCTTPQFLSSVPANTTCPKLPNMNILGVSGDTVIITSSAAPITLQYCVSDTLCTVPIICQYQPLVVGSDDKSVGVSPAPTQAGTLYGLSIQPFTIINAPSGSTKTVTIEATP
jgi:hypothetical protein